MTRVSPPPKRSTEDSGSSLSPRYWHEGRPVPSVTQILKLAGYSPDYANVPASVLERKADLGKKVHEQAANVVGPPGFLRFLADVHAVVLWAEREYVTPFAGGRADAALALPHNVQPLIDIKTRAFDRCSDPVQLAGYEHLSGRRYDAFWIVELDEKLKLGYRLTEVRPTDADRAREDWHAALRVVARRIELGRVTFRKGNPVAHQDRNEGKEEGGGSRQEGHRERFSHPGIYRW